MTTPAHPLTHHEILRLVGPFTRRGRHVDLPASDRIARRLVFKSIEHEAVAACAPACRETLQLDCIDGDDFHLTRILSLPNGLQARLQSDGSSLDDMLARIEAVPAACQICVGPGFAIALSHRLDELPSATRDTALPRLVLTQGAARMGGLTLTLDPPTVRGMRAELLLTAPSGEHVALPDDVLAVLGRDWSRLSDAALGWRSSLRLRRGDDARSHNAEAQLRRAAAHLARVLAEPPACFHERQFGARWRVYARRSVPLLACALLLCATASVPKLHLAENSPWRMLIFNAPPLLLILFFCFRELPRIEIPPWPRRSHAASWRTPPDSAAGPAGPRRPMRCRARHDRLQVNGCSATR